MAEDQQKHGELCCKIYKSFCLNSDTPFKLKLNYFAENELDYLSDIDNICSVKGSNFKRGPVEV